MTWGSMPLHFHIETPDGKLSGRHGTSDVHVGRKKGGKLIKGRDALPEELNTTSGKCGGKS